MRSTNWNGLLAVDKPAGMTSRRIVDHVERIVRPAKVGHAGTLDPLATGVLVIAMGSATRLISYVQQGRKKYVGQFRLGQRSDTDDIEGRITPGGDPTHVTLELLTDFTGRFIGVVSQVPPQYSAIHVDGQRAYTLARRGETVELQARPVEIHSIQVSRFELPDFELQIECGSGTYVRSIGRDLGELLGCGAIMTDLRRTSVGGFSLENAVPFDTLDADSLQRAMRPPLQAIESMPRRHVSAAEISDLRQGRSIVLGEASGNVGSEVALVDAEIQLIGVAKITDRERLQPHLIFPAAMITGS